MSCSIFGLSGARRVGLGIAFAGATFAGGAAADAPAILSSETFEVGAGVTFALWRRTRPETACGSAPL